MRALPLFQGDAQGSLYAVMLFPDDWTMAHAWHARFLARRPLGDYLKAGHDFSDRFEDYLAGVANGSGLDRKEEEARWSAGTLVGSTVTVLWALVCDRDDRAGWSRAIEITSEAVRAQRKKGSPSQIRNQLRRYASVLHLWGAWYMCDTVLPADELMAMSGALLGELRAWDAARGHSFDHDGSYLKADPIGPWAGWVPVVSRLPHPTLRQGLQTNL